MGEKEWSQQEIYIISTHYKGKYINKSIMRALSSVHTSFLYSFTVSSAEHLLFLCFDLSNCIHFSGKRERQTVSRCMLKQTCGLWSCLKSLCFLSRYKTGKCKCSLTISRNSKTLTKTHSLATLSPLKSRKLSKSLDPELHHNKSNTL